MNAWRPASVQNAAGAGRAAVAARPDSRRALFGAALAALAAVAGRAVAQADAPMDQRVELAASKFQFSMTEIHARTGRPLTIVLTSPDFIHGFAIPELGVRADGVPGRVTQIRLTPLRAGRFVYLCDNFCGEGHDRMTGTLIVAADPPSPPGSPASASVRR